MNDDTLNGQILTQFLLTGIVVAQVGIVYLFHPPIWFLVCAAYFSFRLVFDWLLMWGVLFFPYPTYQLIKWITRGNIGIFTPWKMRQHGIMQWSWINLGIIALFLTGKVYELI